MACSRCAGGGPEAERAKVATTVPAEYVHTYKAASGAAARGVVDRRHLLGQRRPGVALERDPPRPPSSPRALRRPVDDLHQGVREPVTVVGLDQPARLPVVED